MQERDVIIVQLTQERVELAENVKAAALHLKIEHGGIPATACHICLNNAQLIINSNYFIDECLRNLEIIDKVSIL